MTNVCAILGMQCKHLYIYISYCDVSTHYQATPPTYTEAVFSMVRAEIVARQQPARQWTGWVAVTSEPKQTRTQ
jgi:hypothetical protein